MKAYIGIPIAVLILSAFIVQPSDAEMSKAELEEEHIWSSVSSMIRLVGETNPGIDLPPLDGTMLLSSIIEGDIDPPPPVRDINPPPSSWDLRHTGTHCEVYTATGLTVPQGDVDAIAAVFESTIYTNATEWFHPVSPPTLVEIRIYDFGDGPQGVGGFFIRSALHANELYVDSQDLDDSRDVTFEIVAHEFQHLLHYDLDPNESVWLDEGMADLSILVTLGPDGEGLGGHIYWYEHFTENDLLTWDEPGLEAIADYGSVFAYVAYIAEHLGGAGTISRIVSEPQNSLESVDHVLQERGYSERAMDVHLRSKVANLVDDLHYGGGIYGHPDFNISMQITGSASTYPASFQEVSTERYCGYYYEITNGNELTYINVNSTPLIHTTLVGTSGGDVVWSHNMTSSGGTPAECQLEGFGTLYNTLYAVPSTSVLEAAFSITVEKGTIVPPETQVVIDPPGPDGNHDYYITYPSITLSTRPDSVVNYRWDDEDLSEYDGPLTPPGEGTRILSFHAEDPRGYLEEERSITFKVDTEPPLTLVTTSPSVPDGNGGYYITSPDVVLHSEEHSSVYYLLGPTVEEYDGPFGLESGSWDLSYWGVDLAGNEEEHRLIHIDVDLKDPEVEAKVSPLSPDGQEGYYITPPSVTLSGTPGAALFYRLDSGEFRAYEGEIPVPDGDHLFSYYAVSESGRTGEVMEIRFKVDSHLPELEAWTDPFLPSVGWVNETVLLTISVDEGSTAYYLIEGDTEEEYLTSFYLYDGVYQITYWATDLAGNRADGSTITARIDTKAPRAVIKVEGNSTDSEGIWFRDEPPVIRFELKDGAGTGSEETIRYRINEGPEMEYDGSRIVPEEGLNMIYYYALDGAGNREKEKTRLVGYEITEDESGASQLLIIGLIAVGVLILLAVTAVVAVLVARKRRSGEEAEWEAEDDECEDWGG